MIFNGVAWEECGEPLYRIRTQAGEGTKRKIELKIDYFLRTEQYLSDHLGDIRNIFNACERDEALSRAEKLKKNWLKKGIEAKVADENRIDVILSWMVLAEPKKIMKRKENRKKTKKLLKKLERFVEEEEGNKEMEEIVLQLKVAMRKIEELREEL